SVNTKNLLVKGGEWKLGVEEEPLPFQIVQVDQVLTNPFNNDQAILILSEELRLAQNVAPICLPPPTETVDVVFNRTEKCIVTGWGKSVLQAHLQGSIIHGIDVSLLAPGECKNKISQRDLSNPLSAGCGQPTNPAHNICKVDVGSAIACTSDGIHYVLRGVYSWDSGCQVKNTIFRFNSVDIEWFRWATGQIESKRFAKFTTTTSTTTESRVPGTTTVKKINEKKVKTEVGRIGVTDITTYRVFLKKYRDDGKCGLQYPQKPYGNRKELELDFAEIPWQAMILLKTDKSLLCGGAIVQPNVVMTTGSCVKDVDTKNLLVKGGEWKLGVEEEPLPFQIVQVDQVLTNPFNNDQAILILSEELRLAQNVAPICLPPPTETVDVVFNRTEKCIVTGWGKSVLQAHLQGSIIHGIDVSLLAPGECKNKISQRDLSNPLSAGCGQPTNPAHNICKVDVGSAIACTSDGIHYVLRGVYSWDSGCQVKNPIFRFNSVDIEWFRWATGQIESKRFAKFTSTTSTTTESRVPGTTTVKKINEKKVTTEVGRIGVTDITTYRVFLKKYRDDGKCGLQYPQKPYGNRKELELDFAEIPWQAMILLKTDKSLLCGGAIVQPNVVMTTGSCVKGVDTKNLLVKGGEWKLGVEEEPLPFQIVQVDQVLTNPFNNDQAILILSEELRLAQNVAPICLPPPTETVDVVFNRTEKCIVTGWGKSVLQAHLQGSIIHGIDVSLLAPGECKNKISQRDLSNPLSAGCGQPTNPAHNICKVDVGSAIACTSDGIHYVLRGVYSWDSGCQVKNPIFRFNSVDIEWFRWATGQIESKRFAKFTTTTSTTTESRVPGTTTVKKINEKNVETGVVSVKTTTPTQQKPNQGSDLVSEKENSKYMRRVFLKKYSGSGECGVQNPQLPQGNHKDSEVDFAEIPWQATIMLQTNYTQLCGGVIARPDVVITSANCVQGLDAEKLVVKTGEWILGEGSRKKEPLPHQIVKVQHILRHPGFIEGFSSNDAAILVLAEDLKLAPHVAPICLPASTETFNVVYNKPGKCIVTGWGKSVLQAHLERSVIHGIGVSVLAPGICANRISRDYSYLRDLYDPKSTACGQPSNPDKNFCQADVGSAVACTTDGIHYVLRGIYSWDSGCEVGKQLIGIYKFDIEWYEWAIGQIESVRFSEYVVTTITETQRRVTTKPIVKSTTTVETITTNGFNTGTTTTGITGTTKTSGVQGTFNYGNAGKNDVASKNSGLKEVITTVTNKKVITTGASPVGTAINGGIQGTVNYGNAGKIDVASKNFGRKEVITTVTNKKVITTGASPVGTAINGGIQGTVNYGNAGKIDVASKNLGRKEVITTVTNKKVITTGASPVGTAINGGIQGTVNYGNAGKIDVASKNVGRKEVITTVTNKKVITTGASPVGTAINGGIQGTVNYGNAGKIDVASKNLGRKEVITTVTNKKVITTGASPIGTAINGGIQGTVNYGNAGKIDVASKNLGRKEVITTVTDKKFITTGASPVGTTINGGIQGISGSAKSLPGVQKPAGESKQFVYTNVGGDLSQLIKSFKPKQ
ncbi:transmembrane protease serine 9-like, partial [Trichoplusia ni]|uniref:Transmembrane protease serine 9-like n=1 Tax=Trichoplusia ni TaxID=7111 RepID=A0A7E5W293_TRINI